MMLKDLDDPGLLQLARKLSSIVLQSQAILSGTKYTGAFRRWKQWAQDHKLPAFKAKEQHVSLYLWYIEDSLKSKVVAEGAVHALDQGHNLVGFESPTQSPLVQITLEGMRRLLDKQVQKSPVSSDILADLVEDYCKDLTLSNICFAAPCLLDFSGVMN